MLVEVSGLLLTYIKGRHYYTFWDAQVSNLA